MRPVLALSERQAGQLAITLCELVRPGARWQEIKNLMISEVIDNTADVVAEDFYSLDLPEMLADIASPDGKWSLIWELDQLIDDPSYRLATGIIETFPTVPFPAPALVHTVLWYISEHCGEMIWDRAGEWTAEDITRTMDAAGATTYEGALGAVYHSAATS